MALLSIAIDALGRTVFPPVGVACRRPPDEGGHLHDLLNLCGREGLHHGRPRLDKPRLNSFRNELTLSGDSIGAELALGSEASATQRAEARSSSSRRILSASSWLNTGAG